MDKIDLEYIGFQNEARILPILKHIEDAVLLINKGYAYNAINFTDKIEDISRGLSEAVGYNITMVFDRYQPMGTYIIPTKQKSSSLLGNLTRTVNDYENTIETARSTSGYTTKFKDVESLLSKSYKALDESLSIKGISLDLQKGYIKGLDKNFTQIISCNLHMLVSTYKFTAREILAVLLHELGHMYVYLVSTINAHSNTLMVLDTIKSEYLSKSSRDVLSIVYNKVTGQNVDTDKMNKYKLVYSIVTAIVTSKTSLATKESEYTADVFAVRFGMGNELATGLAKLHNIKVGSTPNNLAASNVFLGILIVTGLAVTILLTVLTIISDGVLAGLSFGFMMCMMQSFLLVAGGNPDGTNRYDSWSYDTFRDRISRIRQQMIAKLKDSTLKAEDIKTIISQIDAVKDIIDSTPPLNKSFMDRIISFFKKDKISNIDINYIVESFMDSDLVLAKARLNSLV